MIALNEPVASYGHRRVPPARRDRSCNRDADLRGGMSGQPPDTVKLIKLAVSRRRSTLGLVRCLVGGDKIQGDSNRRSSLRFLALTKGSEFQRVTVANRSENCCPSGSGKVWPKTPGLWPLFQGGKGQRGPAFRIPSAPPNLVTANRCRHFAFFFKRWRSREQLVFWL